jgi:serine/threonine protein kinase
LINRKNIEEGTYHLRILTTFGGSNKNNLNHKNKGAYRNFIPPELILGKKLSSKVDIWSLGCTIFQLINGEPLFPEQRERPVLRNAYLLSLMSEHIRKFPLIYTQLGAKAKLYFDKEGKLKQIHGFDLLAETVSLGCISKDSDLMGLLNGCLQYEAHRRPSVCDIIDHQWIKQAIKSKVGQTTKQKAKSLSDRLLGIGKGIILDTDLADDSINNYGEEGESSLILAMGSPNTARNKIGSPQIKKSGGGFWMEEDSPQMKTNKAILWSRVDGLLHRGYEDRRKILSQNLF